MHHLFVKRPHGRPHRHAPARARRWGATALAALGMLATTSAGAPAAGVETDISEPVVPQPNGEAPVKQEQPATGQAVEQTAVQQEPRKRKRARLTLSEAKPRNVILGKRSAKFRFELAGRAKRDLLIRAIDTSNGKSVRAWRRDDVRGGKRHEVRWDGTRRGRFVAQDKYTFKVYDRAGGGDPVDSRRAKGKSRVTLHRHQFPISARHTYGDGFGAGRGHKGADVFAACGKKLRAARGGRVQTSSYQSSAGHYVVIDGRGTGWDYAYMHLLKRQKVKEGKRVRTGDVIGLVGETGNAQGCHLHFEMWSPPGWYEGGSPQPVKRALRGWDRYS